ncbi:TAT (twin-arginine translocation) pathway signal sequence [Azotosporobacter soli]|uniref:TAT (twin-arginine translocation) pathway signal sequence n=1 Tax=Azotosporobacter soli TaxID=3055040 RepID=UPI0031FEBBD6
MKHSLSRTLKQSALTLSAITLLAGALPPSVLAAPISLADCQNFSPTAMAEQSSYIMNSYQYLLKTSQEISDPQLRQKTADYLANPVPSLWQRFPGDAEKESLKQQLVAAGYLSASASYDQFLPPMRNTANPPQPFYAAPGSGYMSHHAYPGGLATHVASNVKIALGIYNTYKDVYGITLNKDVIIASEMLHDLHKPWVFQWQSDAASLKEYSIAGTGSHHILSIAEAMYRNFPKEVVVAIACAHNHPGTAQDEAQVVSWLKAAALISGKDPIAAGYLAPSGETLPQPRWIEGFVTHLGDHDFVLTVPMAQWTIAQLQNIAKAHYGMSEQDLHSAKFYAFRDYVFSQATIERLYTIWVQGGEQKLTDTVLSLVKP